MTETKYCFDCGAPMEWDEKAKKMRCSWQCYASGFDPDPEIIRELMKKELKELQRKKVLG